MRYDISDTLSAEKSAEMERQDARRRAGNEI
jgi:hypothetical protein